MQPITLLVLLSFLVSSARAGELPAAFPKGKRPANYKEVRELLKPLGFDVHRPKIAAPEGLRTLKDIAYAERETGALKLDLFLPAKTDTAPPLVILVHGGGWKKGSKEQELTKAHWFTARGYACAAVQYRLSGVAKFPGARDDLRDAVAWLRSKAGEYGYDPKRFATFGGSAGAHLVALHATATSEAEQKVQATIVVAGPTDTVSKKVRERSRAPDNNYFLWMGAPLDEKPALYLEASPADHVSEASSPCIVFSENTAENDQRFHAALTAAGVANESHLLTAALHPSWNWEPWFTFTMERADAFLKKTL